MWKVIAIVGVILMALIAGCVVILGTAVHTAVDNTNQQRGRNLIDGIDSNSTNSEHPPQKDITQVTCDVDDSGDMRAVIHITNHSSERSNYSIDVVFESKDGTEQLDSSFAGVSHLEAGQSATTQSVTFTAPPSTGFSCRVTQIDRYAS